MSTIPQDLIVPDFARVTALVVGDVMLDRYWYGATSRISPEAPVPVVHVQDVEERAGGAGNVAVNVRALGAAAVLVGIVGDDGAATSLEALLDARGVTHRLERRPGNATVTKLRVVSRHQQLLRLDFEDRRTGGVTPGSQWLAAEGIQVMVLSDYAKGALDDPAPLIRRARDQGIPVVVDPKGRDFRKYRGATVLTPNLTEFEAVVGDCDDLETLVARGGRLRDELELEALLITRSEHGMTLITADGARHIPARVREVFDVTGAGDTVVATLAAALGAGLAFDAAAWLANLAAGLVVGKLGTAAVSRAELRGAVQEHEGRGSGVVDESALLALVEAARRKGQRVVMTNGCFDILHAGHVRYLEQARALGDRLVVAVNDDASVKRLKGHDRPINPLSRRAAVLDALAAVDWVASFAEDTPQRLICAVKPEVLVKGGDYRPGDIAGGDCVRAHGGEVVVLEFLEGCSTTDIIDAVKGRVREPGVESS